MLRLRQTILCLVLLALGGRGISAASIVSSMPAFYTPGQPITVTLNTTPGPGVLVQAVEESIPVGWSVGVISHGGSLDPVNGRIKWGPFADGFARALSFEITPPVNARGAFSFSGKGSFDGVIIPITGVLSAAKFPGALHRTIPPNYLPGATIDIILDAAPADDVFAWAAEDLVPAGWLVADISEGGVFDALSTKVKWGPFFDSSPRQLHYSITPPSEFRASGVFIAHVQFDDAPLSDTTILPIRASTLTRSSPATYRPNTPFQVTLNVAAQPYVTVIAIEESISPGWTPFEIQGGGVWDATNRKIKWGPFLASDISSATLSYKLNPAANASAALELRAVAKFDAFEETSDATVERFLNNPVSRIVRSLPATYHPAIPITVSIAATPIDTALVYAYQENVPVGWTVSNISSGGVFDSTNRRIKWGPFFDSVATARTFTYKATPPNDAFGVVDFLGSGVFDDEMVFSDGASEISNAPPVVARVLPARFNPGAPLVVTINAKPVPGILTYAVEEQVPDGWNVSNISDGGAFDTINRKIKWGPFLDADLRPLTYTVTPPALATGTNSFSGGSLFNTETISITGSNAVRLNRAPAAIAHSLRRPLTSFFKISVFTLLAGATDADADFLRVESVSAQSSQGGTLDFEWPWIFYSPPDGPPTIDEFTYTINDGFGGTSTALVTLTPTPPDGAPAQNIIRLVPLPGGAAQIFFSGVPTFLYHIETSPDLIHWTPAADRIANNVGQFDYTDTSAASVPIRFYRTLWP